MMITDVILLKKMIQELIIKMKIVQKLKKKRKIKQQSLKTTQLRIMMIIVMKFVKGDNSMMKEVERMLL